MRIYISDISIFLIQKLLSINENIKLNVLKAYSHKLPFGDNRELSLLVDSPWLYNSLFIDSGAYEIFKDEKHIRTADELDTCFARYISFILKNREKIALYANFDVDFIGIDRFEINLSYQKIIENAQLKPIPVIHSLDKAEIDYYISKQYPIVSISSRVMTNKTQSSYSGVSEVIDILLEKGIKTHLLGAGSYALLKDCNAWSCDCSSFAQWCSAGRVIFFSEHFRKEENLALSERTSTGETIKEYCNNIRDPNIKILRNEYENFIHTNLNFTIDMLLADQYNVMMANAFYYYTLERRITALQKERGITFDEW